MTIHDELKARCKRAPDGQAYVKVNGRLEAVRLTQTEKGAVLRFVGNPIVRTIYGDALDHGVSMDSLAVNVGASWTANQWVHFWCLIGYSMEGLLEIAAGNKYRVTLRLPKEKQ